MSASQHNLFATINHCVCSDCVRVGWLLPMLIMVFSIVLNSRNEQRIKSATTDVNVISRIQHLPLCTTPQFVEHSQNQSHHNLTEFIRNFTKETFHWKQCKRLLNELALKFPLISTQQNKQLFYFRALKRSISNKMKDLVNGKNLIENNGDLLLEQKPYSNGTSNGHR